MFRLGERAAARREAGPTLFIPKFVPPADGCQLLAAALSAIHRAGAASAGDQNVETQFSLKSIHWIDFFAGGELQMKWWLEGDLNSRPHDYESCALTS